MILRKGNMNEMTYVIMNLVLALETDLHRFFLKKNTG